MGIQPETQYILDHFPYVKDGPGFFIECGANDGEYYSVCKPLEDAYGWTGVNIECNPWCWEDLQRNRPDCINLRLALAAESHQTLQFQIPRNDASGRDRKTGMASFLKMREWGNREIEKVSVITLTYADLLRYHRIEKVDLFVLDIEGAEMTVLNSLTPDMVLPKIFCVEFVHIPGKKATVDQCLLKLGYKFIGRRGHNIMYELQ